MSEDAGPLPQSSMILYQTEDGRTRVECRFENQTIWLTQALIAELFDVTVPNVNIHLKAIYEEGELDPGATIKSYLIVRTEGNRQVSREVLHYSLPAILAVGYRLTSCANWRTRQKSCRSGRGGRKVLCRRDESHRSVLCRRLRRN